MHQSPQTRPCGGDNKNLSLWLTKIHFLFILHSHCGPTTAAILLSSLWNPGWQNPSGTLPVTRQAVCWLLKLLPCSATFYHQSNSHGHSCDSWVELYNLPPGRGTEIFGTSNRVYHRHVRQNTSKRPTYHLLPIQNLPELSLDSVTWHHCVLCSPSWKLHNHF